MRLKPKIYDEIAFDTDAAGDLSRKIMQEKKCLHDIYAEQYQWMAALTDRYLVGEGKELEIGSGGGFMKLICPQVITTDVRRISGVDMVMDAMDMPFPARSVRSVLAVHVLHHIPDIERFFRELDRVLTPGGGLVAIEPYWGPLASYIYTYIHPEPFDKQAPSWKLKGGGPMTGSNQALSYLLLKRDAKAFQAEFPQFHLRYEQPFGFLRYMATGGIWLSPKLPAFMFPVLRGLESTLFKPLMPWVGLHHIFVLQKQ